jgi:hypothetical protein
MCLETFEMKAGEEFIGGWSARIFNGESMNIATARLAHFQRVTTHLRQCHSEESV